MPGALVNVLELLVIQCFEQAVNTADIINQHKGENKKNLFDLFDLSAINQCTVGASDKNPNIGKRTPFECQHCVTNRQEKL